MCGITGYVGRGGKEILKKMTGSLRHRGPDDQGFYFENNLGLGHQRLSIIDLQTGHQPIFNEDKTIVVVFNGEVYNFQNLRKELIDQGHGFYTQTDTEVIAHLYEDRGEDFLQELNGMFALALWDKKEKKLILARDRLGQKPLYYSLNGQTLVFGSELKSLLKYPYIKKELDYESLAKYLAYEYVPAPDTIFSGIKKLGPGEYLCNGVVKKYWDVKFSDGGLSLKDYLWEFDRRLEKSVCDRLMSDVPLGVFLSGGIDSSSIAYYAQKNSSRKIKTFSIGFTDSSFDESSYIHRIAKFLGTEHHEQILRPADCLDLIPRVSEFLDEPLADASLIPTYLLSKFTSREVKVALGGDGGDELLMGYPTFQAHKAAQLYRHLPSFVKKLVGSAVGLLPVSFDNISLDFMLKRFVSGVEYPPEIQDLIWLGSFGEDEIRRLLGGSFDVYGAVPDFDRFDQRLIYQYLKGYLQDDILVKVDRASMANGLEVRAPFLDHNLVDFLNSVPAKFKLKGFCSKYLFKELMKDRLPREIVYRKKKGFGIPVGKWIRTDLREFTLDMLNKEKIKREGIFDYGYISLLLKDHFSGKKDNRKLLWTLLMFEVWLGRWG